MTTSSGQPLRPSVVPATGFRFTCLRSPRHGGRPVDAREIRVEPLVRASASIGRIAGT
jgi:hypothetical protein